MNSRRIRSIHPRGIPKEYEGFSRVLHYLKLITDKITLHISTQRDVRVQNKLQVIIQQKEVSSNLAELRKEMEGKIENIMQMKFTYETTKTITTGS